MWIRFDQNGDQNGLAFDEQTKLLFEQHDGYVYHDAPDGFDSETQVAKINNGVITLDSRQDPRDSLEFMKKLKERQIDNKTAKLFKAGFGWANERFSLSDRAQRNWIVIGMNNTNGVLPFPCGVSTIDGGEYLITDTTEANNFYLTAVGTGKAYYDAGRALRLQAHNATTIEELEAIVDNR